MLRALKQRDVPFLVGGAFAMARYTQIDRPTKDLDLMVRRAHWPAVATALRQRRHLHAPLVPALAGQSARRVGAGGHHLQQRQCRRRRRRHCGSRAAVPARVLGYDVALAPPEELVWSKSFLMERERFDGADVLHLILRAGRTLDWDHLCDRFYGHERVLLAHLMLFNYAYPNETAHRATRRHEAFVGSAEPARHRRRSALPRQRSCRANSTSSMSVTGDTATRGWRRSATSHRLKWRRGRARFTRTGRRPDADDRRRYCPTARLATGASNGRRSGRTRTAVVIFNGRPSTANVNSTNPADHPRAGGVTRPTQVFGPTGVRAVGW